MELNSWFLNMCEIQIKTKLHALLKKTKIKD